MVCRSTVSSAARRFAVIVSRYGAVCEAGDVEGITERIYSEEATCNGTFFECIVTKSYMYFI